MAVPYFQKFESRPGGDWYLRLRAGNHETVFSGEGYASEQGVDRAIDMLKDFGLALANAEVKTVRRPSGKMMTATKANTLLGNYLRKIMTYTR
jgi:uncharacterized protein YegP (UPF0339 family)